MIIILHSCLVIITCDLFIRYIIVYVLHDYRVELSCVYQGNGRMLRQNPSSHLLLNAHTEQRVSLQILPHALMDAHTGRSVQRDELMTVLADVAALRVRAQLEGSAEGTLRSERKF